MRGRPPRARPKCKAAPKRLADMAVAGQRILKEHGLGVGPLDPHLIGVPLGESTYQTCKIPWPLASPGPLSPGP